MRKEKVFLAQYTLPNIFKIGPVRFIPGINRVSESDWNQIKNHPLLPHRFDNGHLIWIKDKGPNDYSLPVSNENKNKESPVDAEILNTFNAKEAIELVEKTYDLDLLELWKNNENRKGVSGAIDDQISSLLKQSEEPEEG